MWMKKGEKEEREGGLGGLNKYAESHVINWVAMTLQSSLLILTVPYHHWFLEDFCDIVWYK